jgi:hypothetical protein
MEDSFGPQARVTGGAWEAAEKRSPGHRNALGGRAPERRQSGGRVVATLSPAGAQ